MLSNFFAGSVSVQRRSQLGVDLLKKFVISSESVRFLAFVCFWGFCAFAIAMNRMFTYDYLKPIKLENGEYEDKGQCGPFKPIPGENLTITRNFGFNVYNESHLQHWFGFANICTNWDYHPSRELTAMVFPLFEYSLVAYLVFNYIQCGIHHKKGELSDKYMRALKIVTPIQIIFCIWFRLIFVFIAYESPRGHTMGFMFLQLALIIMNIMNPIYVLETKQNYKFLNFLGCGRFNGTRVFAWTNMIITFLVGMAKLYATAYIVFNWGEYDEKTGAGEIYPKALLNPNGPLGKNYGWWIDKFFMAFVAVMPLIVSFARWKHEPAMTVEFDLLPAKEEEEDVVGEGTPLVA